MLQTEVRDCEKMESDKNSGLDWELEEKGVKDWRNYECSQTGSFKTSIDYAQWLLEFLSLPCARALAKLH